MKKIINLSLSLLILLTSCSLSKNDNSKIPEDVKEQILDKITELEKKENKSEADYIELAKNYQWFAGESKNFEVSKQMADKIKKIIDNHCNNPEIEAYYGFAYAIMGRDHPVMSKKTPLVSKGLSIIDNAMEKISDNVQLRFARAEMSLYLPPFFNRTEIAIKDYQFLVTNYENKKIKIDKWQIGQIYQHLGDSLIKVNRTQEAITAWGKAIKIDPDSESAKNARTMLSQYEK